MSNGTAAQTMKTRKKNEKRMLPVKSEIKPTTRGPMKELDYFIVKLGCTSRKDGHALCL